MFSPIIVLHLFSRLLVRQPACLQTHYPCCQNQAAPDKNSTLAECCFWICLAVRTRLELATPCVTGMYSNQTELPDRFYNPQKPVAFCFKSECKSTTFFNTDQIFFLKRSNFAYNTLIISMDYFKLFLPTMRFHPCKTWDFGLSTDVFRPSRTSCFPPIHEVTFHRQNTIQLTVNQYIIISRNT